MKTIWHGSEIQLRQPFYHGGKPYNDYGYGFYCTEQREMAMEWAVSREHDGYANRYLLEEDGLKILDLSRDFTVLTWIATLLQYRTFSIDTPLGREAKAYLIDTFAVDVETYDLVCGWRADDSYFAYAQDFLSGAISCEQLRGAMELGQMGMQIVLKSRRAYERLHYQGAERALREEWLERKLRRDRQARTAYLKSDRFRYHRGELYVTQILDEEVKPDDARLR